MKKLKWVHKGKNGNWLNTWTLFVTFENRELAVGEIIEFNKGVYCLPSPWFPRNDRLQLKKVKSLARAKKMTIDKFKEFIKSQSGK